MKLCPECGDEVTAANDPKITNGKCVECAYQTDAWKRRMDAKKQRQRAAFIRNDNHRKDHERRLDMHPVDRVRSAVNAAITTRRAGLISPTVTGWLDDGTELTVAKADIAFFAGNIAELIDQVGKLEHVKRRYEALRDAHAELLSTLVETIADAQDGPS